MVLSIDGCERAEHVLQWSPHDLRVGRRGRVVVVLFHRGGGGGVGRRRVVLLPVEHRMLPGKGGVVGMMMMAIAYCTCNDHAFLANLLPIPFSGKFVLGNISSFLPM